jgi:D-sedoheptulose 7-phosphate isomerase
MEALGRAGDLLMVHTTSGNSPHCLRAIEAARLPGMRSIAMTAKDGGRVKVVADLCLLVPTKPTDRAQKVHLAIQHGICDVVGGEVAGGKHAPRTTRHPKRVPFVALFPEN